MGRSLLIMAASLGMAAICVGQLPLVQLAHFSHPVFSGSGTVGVVKNSMTGNIIAIDFDQTAALQAFSPNGTAIGSWNAIGCTPSLPTPNGITQNRTTGNAFLVDNSNGKVVAEMTPGGACINAWPLPLAGNNPMSIAHHGISGDLLIGSYAAITRWTTSGTQVGASIPVFFPNLGSWIVSGLAWVPPTDRLIIAQNGGSDLYEIDMTGVPISITPLAPWGITNIQGLDYDPASGHLLVIDNATARVHVFDYLPPTPALSLAVTAMPTGAATMTLLNLPATTAEGWTLVSGLVSAPVGAGTIFGLQPDPFILALVLGFPQPQIGHPFHWVPTTLPRWPQTPFAFPAGTFTPLQGTTLDIVALALDGQGVGIQASDVARVTF